MKMRGALVRTELSSAVSCPPSTLICPCDSVHIKDFDTPLIISLSQLQVGPQASGLKWYRLWGGFIMQRSLQQRLMGLWSTEFLCQQRMKPRDGDVATTILEEIVGLSEVLEPYYTFEFLDSYSRVGSWGRGRSQVWIMSADGNYQGTGTWNYESMDEEARADYRVSFEITVEDVVKCMAMEPSLAKALSPHF